MTVCAVLASLIPILWATGIGSDVMKPIALLWWEDDHFDHPRADFGAVFFVLMKERALRRAHCDLSSAYLQRTMLRFLALLGML